MTVEIIIGDALAELKRLADDSVDMVCTSPPYWGLRDYGVDGQLGLEPSWQTHVEVIADLFDEVRRVLKPQGTLWLKLRGLPPRHQQYLDSSDQSGLDTVPRGGLRNRRSVWTVATQPFSEAHFATFPPELIAPCILAGCPVGGTVLDPFGGTVLDPFGGAGTTGLVADRLQRNAILIELNPEYAAMARARIDRDRGGLLDAMEAA